jgi:hypothetical protein
VWNLCRNIFTQIQGKKQCVFTILRLGSVTMARWTATLLPARITNTVIHSCLYCFRRFQCQCNY